jgi:uncharacterized protein YeaO (DUF488 family)
MAGAAMSDSDQTPRIKRAYEPTKMTDGRRILVDRLWPRGLARGPADIHEWCSRVAPSHELRRWYGHEPKRFEEFAARYRAELEEPERAEALEILAATARERQVTLLTATRDLPHSHAPVLLEALIDRL